MRGRFRRALVVIEGAYSQDGDLPDLPRFIEVKRRHDAMLMIDEAHSLGVLGRTGRGVGEHFGVDPGDVDLWMGTLSKAIGSLGGYIAARRPLIQFMKYTTPLYIFSTGISPASAAAALEAFRVIRDEPGRVTRLHELAEHFRAAARARGLDTGVSDETAVIPIIVGDWGRAMEISSALLERGVNVMPIGYPAVPRQVPTAVLRQRRPPRSRPRPLPRPSGGRHGHDIARQQPTARAAAGFGAAPREGRRRRARDRCVRVHRRASDQEARRDRAPGAGARAGRRRPVGVRGPSRRDRDRLLTDLDALLRATDGVRHVYNCAGKSADWGPWEEFEQANVTGCRNLVDAAHRAYTVERFVHLSTTDVYGYPVRPCDERTEPNDIGLPYNRSKLLGERAVTEAAERAACRSPSSARCRCTGRAARTSSSRSRPC